MQLFALFLLVAAVACIAGARAQSTQNTYEGMIARDATCGTKYQDLQTTYYDGTPCKDLVYQALDTYLVANCPGGGVQGTAVGSDVWKCMSGSGNNTALISAWVNFVKNCEIFYIAARKPAGETEDGFSWQDNSCFQRFADLSSFQEYLYGYNVDGGNSAGSIAFSLVTIFAGVILVLAMLM